MKDNGDNSSSVKKPAYIKGLLVLVVIILIVYVYGHISSWINDKNNDTPSQSVETEGIEENNAEGNEESSSETAIRKAIEKVVGKENIDTFNYVPITNFSLIKFRGRENLTSKMTVNGMYLDIFNILKEIKPIIDTDVAFNVIYPLQDKYGNSTDVIVIKATFKNATIKKINFENASFKNIPDMADEWWKHNALNVN